MASSTLATAEFHTIAADGVSVTLDLAVGHIRRFEVHRGGRIVAPLHAAPWIADPQVAADERIAPNVRRLSGDFFCAAFGLNDVEAAPTHGWSANSAWRFVEDRRHPDGGVTACFELQRRIMGARVGKELTLRDGDPFLYQCHRLVGGAGGITAAHHVMTRLMPGDRSTFSPKACADLPPMALEPDPTRGRSILRYPSRTTDLSALPLAGGGTADLQAYPFAERHEDFLMLVEAPGNRLGWTAIVRHSAADALLILKDPRILPVTLVWMSNAGRDYAPWSGRHAGVLGIEDARCWSLFGHAASVAANPLSQSGVPTSFALAPSDCLSVRHVIGALPLPAGWRSIEALEAAPGSLTVEEAGGASLTIPFDDRFLSGASDPP